MLPGGLFVSRPDFLRRVAVKQRAPRFVELFAAACVSCVRHKWCRNADAKMFFPALNVPGLSVDNGGSHVLRWMWCPGAGRPSFLQSLRQTIRRASDRPTVKHRPRATACSSVRNSLASLLCLECDWRRGFVYHREHALRARRRNGSASLLASFAQRGGDIRSR
jgi:hypothetical protein